MLSPGHTKQIRESLPLLAPGRRERICNASRTPSSSGIAATAAAAAAVASRECLLSPRAAPAARLILHHFYRHAAVCPLRCVLRGRAANAKDSGCWILRRMLGPCRLRECAPSPCWRASWGRRTRLVQRCQLYRARPRNCNAIRTCSLPAGTLPPAPASCNRTTSKLSSF